MNNIVAIILFLVFYILAELLIVAINTNKDLNIHIIITTLGILFVIILSVLDKILKPDTKDNYKEPENQDFQPSLRSLCKGGKYMWQGNTPLDKACRDMYDNPDKAKTLRNPDNSYTRGAKPYADFAFDPIIDDQFEFVRCSNRS